MTHTGHSQPDRPRQGEPLPRLYRCPLRRGRKRWLRLGPYRRQFRLPPPTPDASPLVLRVETLDAPAEVAVPGRRAWVVLLLAEIPHDVWAGRAWFAYSPRGKLRHVAVSAGGRWSCDCTPFKVRHRCRHVAAAVELFALSAAKIAA